MSIKTKGKCKYCSKEYTKAGMAKHLKTCKSRDVLLNKSSEKMMGYYSIVVEGKYNNDYWLIIEAREDATLEDVDSFLRDIWLECCNHLSAFTIDNEKYEANPEDSWSYSKPSSINIKLEDILRIGLEFEHQYDFGSTTELKLKVFNYQKINYNKENVVLISRNKMETHQCNYCDEKAEYFDIDYENCQATYLCEDCLDHYDYPDMCVPISNSPRCGVCGYSGSEMYGN